MIPIQLGSEEDFRIVRECLVGSRFSSKELSALLGIEGLHDVLIGKGEAPKKGPAGDRLSMLARLLVLGNYVPGDELRAALPKEAEAALTRLGLLTEDAGAPGLFYSPVMLCPMGGLFFVSDRYSAPDRSRFTPEGDTVYPAITKGTGRFVEMLPATRCGRLLDLCSGTGVAALSTVANDSAREAWAIDVTGRSSLFAEFNRRLNGVEGVKVLQGDLYEPVREMVFDRIVAHPPYVPAVETKWIFRDSGEIGEAITRRIIDNLPAALTPGGRLYCLTTGMERKDAPYERRIRQWLGNDSREFDLLLVELESYTLEVLISALAFGGQRTVEECRDLKTRFEEVDAKSFFHGFVVIQRRSSPRQAFTVRRKSGPETGSREVEWLMGWLTKNAEPVNRGELLSTRFMTSEKCEMTVEHRMEDGKMAVSGMGLRTRHPFDMECRIQPWTGQFIAECGHPMTGQEIYDYCRREEIIRGQVTAQDFTALLDMLASGGFLEVVEAT